MTLAQIVRAWAPYLLIGAIWLACIGVQIAYDTQFAGASTP